MSGQDQPNYPKQNLPPVVSTPGVSFNPTAAEAKLGFQEHRGKAEQTAGPNYSGGAGTGITQPKNSPPTK